MTFDRDSAKKVHTVPPATSPVVAPLCPTDPPERRFSATQPPEVAHPGSSGGSTSFFIPEQRSSGGLPVRFHELLRAGPSCDAAASESAPNGESSSHRLATSKKPRQPGGSQVADSMDDYNRAATTPAAERTPAQRQMMQTAHDQGMTTVTNAEHEANRLRGAGVTK